MIISFYIILKYYNIDIGTHEKCVINDLSLQECLDTITISRFLKWYCLNKTEQ